jgi:hypothetical protein
MVLQHISVWLHGSGYYPGHWIGHDPEASVSWPPRSPDLNPTDFYLAGSMKNVVHANIVDTREKLLQRMQDAANEIRTTPGVFRHHSFSWRASWAFVAVCVTSKFSPVRHSVRDFGTLFPRNFIFCDFLQNHLRTYVPQSFLTYWLPETPQSFMAHNLETSCITLWKIVLSLFQKVNFQ